jgi:hypothetical protein
MICVDSVGRASQHWPTRRALAPQWLRLKTTTDLSPNVVYDPQAILALRYAGCRVAQLKGVIVTHDNMAAKDSRERRARP